MDNEIRKMVEEKLKSITEAKTIDININEDVPEVTIPLSRYDSLVKCEVLYEQIIFLAATHDSYDLGNIVYDLIRAPKKEKEESPSQAEPAAEVES